MSDKAGLTLIFDIGKTNKKVLLFDNSLKLIYQEETSFAETTDDDGFLCDDFDKIELWLQDKIISLIKSEKFNITKINFTTYGATLVYLDKEGKRLTPVYNYLKPLGADVDELIFKKWGGKNEFLRKTASPALKMLNSGFQILKLRQEKADIFKNIEHILHLPQYLSFLLTKKITSEATSIGCHTALWDYDNMKYHDWLKSEGIKLPKPIDNSMSFPTIIEGKQIELGIGIHDSSASLVPYLMGSSEEFVLVSTGTWCINMNPFNNEPLTDIELKNDCLSFLTYQQKPVKSSRVFLGHIHDVNIKKINDFFNVAIDAYKTLAMNTNLLKALLAKSKQARVFFKNGIPDNYIDEQIDLAIFENFEHCYYQFIIDLAFIVSDSINLIINSKQKIKHLYITGGFARNKQFTHTLASINNQQSVFTSEIDNATALGAALVLNNNMNNNINLGLNKVEII